MRKLALPSRKPSEWLSSLPVCLMLVLVVVFNTSTDIHNQMLRAGESIWSSYYELRSDPVEPTCNPMVNIDDEVERQVEKQADDDLADLLGEAEVDRDAIRRSVMASVQRCETRHLRYIDNKDRITPAVRAFRTVEQGTAEIAETGPLLQRPILLILILICAATATFNRHQIAMRGIESRLDYRVSYSAQVVANLMLLASTWVFRETSHATIPNMSEGRALLHVLWIACFGVLTAVSVYRLVRMPEGLNRSRNPVHAIMSIPIYAIMTLVAGTYFFLDNFSQGIGLYLNALMSHIDIFINVALYVWAGMMLKQTRLATLVFDVFRPWKMPPEMLATVAVVVAAVPTAYTGASGIFVIAAGAVIYSELRAAGARRQLALAATAMSGSMGVVLRPCLLVVVIAMLNREVTTNDLFTWGLLVFALSAVLFLLVTMTINRQGPLKFAPAREAFPEMLLALRPLIPYVLVIAGVVVFYNYGLGVSLDEFSAPRILPIMLISILVYEAIRFRGREVATAAGRGIHRGLETTIRKATNDTTAEIGALLLLFGLSISLGGVIERAGVMEHFPEAFASPWIAMSLMVLMLVGLGMIMDAFGAVILVTATVATVAYQSGIHPIHFWMLTLVAFELGYLTPPVSLNHLLTRQVVGDEEVRLSRLSDGSFYQRHERIVMPMLVMGITLLIVAYVPLLFYAL